MNLVGIHDGGQDEIEEDASTEREIALSDPPTIGETVTVNVSSDDRIG